jgi:outer membrane receptor protein involved in Fe transport
MGNASVLRRIVLTLVLGLMGQALWAQSTAAVSGFVRDRNGGALPGATVVLKAASGGAQRTATADAQGAYAFTAAEPGAYALSAGLDGFVTAEAQVTVAAGKPVTHDFALDMVSFFENVTVTAQKREEQILDVPASITAVTGKTFEAQGVTSLQQIAATIPALSIVESGPGTQRAQIRGISSPQNLPTVGTYLDEMPVNAESSGAGLDVRLLDLDRVEVLRGPQGTLYGEGSMGGTIKYVTKDPERDTVGVRFDSAYGTITDGEATYRASLVANIPVVEGKFGLRVVAGQEHQGGWIDYPAQDREDGNQGDSTTLRLKGLWIVSDTFSASLMLQAQKSDYDDQNFWDLDGTAPFVLPQPIEDENRAVNLVLNWDAGSFTVMSSTGFLHRESDGAYDFTSLYVPYLPPGLIDTVALTYGGDSDTVSEEIRLASKGDSKLTWTAGAYWRKFDGTSYNESVTTPNPFPFELFIAHQDQQTEQTAVFGELGYAFSSKLDATLGLRYFHDKREQQSDVGQFGPPADNPDQSGTFDSTNPRFVLSYRPAAGRLVYASAAKGFRSGGFNLVPPGCSIPTDFDPESLWTYEIGSSASFDSGRVVVQGALYHNDWQDIQTLTLCPGTYVALTDNVGKATGNGVDLQLTLSPTRAVRFTLSGNYNDSTYDNDSYAHVEGDRIDYASEYNYGLAVDWSFRWAASLPGMLHVDYQTTGPFDLNFRNFGLTQPLSSDTVSGLNARLAMTLGSVELSLYGQNLLDEDGAVSPAIPIGGVPSAIRPQPMTVGLGFAWRY